MKHAGPEAVAQLERLISMLRKRELLVEKRSGTFYLRSKAFIHFHEDPAGLFADVRLDGIDFARHRVSTRREQGNLLGLIDARLAEVE